MIFGRALTRLRLPEGVAFPLRMLPGGKLLLRFLAGDAVRLLDLSRELLAVARARVELIAGELAPMPQGVALEMLPLAFNAIPFHLIPFWQRSGCRVFLDHPMMRARAPSHRCASAQRQHRNTVCRGNAAASGGLISFTHPAGGGREALGSRACRRRSDRRRPAFLRRRRECDTA